MAAWQQTTAGSGHNGSRQTQPLAAGASILESKPYRTSRSASASHVGSTKLRSASSRVQALEKAAELQLAAPVAASTERACQSCMPNIVASACIVQLAGGPCGDCGS
jgi:hypothetical protein